MLWFLSSSRVTRKYLNSPQTFVIREDSYSQRIHCRLSDRIGPSDAPCTPVCRPNDIRFRNWRPPRSPRSISFRKWSRAEQFLFNARPFGSPQWNAVALRRIRRPPPLGHIHELVCVESVARNL